MKYLKIFEGIHDIQKYHVNDLVVFKDIHNLIIRNNIPESKLDEFYHFFNNRIGVVRNAWVGWVEVKYYNLPKSLTNFANIYDGIVSVFECHPYDLRFATDIEIAIENDIKKFNL